MKKQLGVMLGLLLFSGLVFAGGTIDFDVVVESVLTWVSNIEDKIVQDKGIGEEVYFTSGGNFLSSCSGDALIWTADSTDKNIFVEIQDLNESGANFSLEIGGEDFEISEDKNYSYPVSSVGDLVCLKAKILKNGKARIVYGDFKVVQ